MAASTGSSQGSPSSPRHMLLYIPGTDLKQVAHNSCSLRSSCHNYCLCQVYLLDLWASRGGRVEGWAGSCLTSRVCKVGLGCSEEWQSLQRWAGGGYKGTGTCQLSLPARARAWWEGTQRRTCVLSGRFSACYTPCQADGVT